MSIKQFAPQIVAILPAFNDAGSVGAVVRSLLESSAQQAIVVDRGSADGTATEARHAGAKVIVEAGASFGQAFFAALTGTGFGDQIILLCALDGSDDPRQAVHLVEPLVDGRADMAVGTHTVRERAWTKPLLALPEMWLRRRMKLDCGAVSTFIAIRRAQLERLGLCSCHVLHFEMQIKAALMNIPCAEVLVTPGPGRKVGPLLSLKQGLAKAIDVADLILTYDPLRPGGARARRPPRGRPQPRIDCWPHVTWSPWLPQQPRFRN